MVTTVRKKAVLRPGDVSTSIWRLQQGSPLTAFGAVQLLRVVLSLGGELVLGRLPYSGRVPIHRSCQR